jgi:hypothetical protein
MVSPKTAIEDSRLERRQRRISTYSWLMRLWLIKVWLFKHSLLKIWLFKLCDKGMITKAHSVGTPEARSGGSP